MERQRRRDGGERQRRRDGGERLSRLRMVGATRAARLGVGAVAAAVLVWLVILPLRPATSNSTLFTLTLMFTAVAVSVNWNLTGGFTGYVDFGHAVWFGIGGYTTAVLTSQQGIAIGWGPVPAIVTGTVVAGALAVAIGRATMRLKGPYFSIAMLGTFVAMREIVRVASPLTNGGEGLTIPPYLNRPLFYYIELLLLVVLVALSWWLRRTRFGAALVAIREDEVGAEMRGIDAVRYKVTIFGVAGASTGLFGGLWAYQNTFVDPDIAFVETRTIDAVMGTMLGGLGTVPGPVLGSVVLFWLRELVWERFLDVHLIVQGVLLIVIVLYVPRGLVGIVDPRATSLATLWNRWLDRNDRAAGATGDDGAADGGDQLAPGGCSGPTGAGTATDPAEADAEPGAEVAP